MNYSAIFDTSREYRYVLERRWNDELRVISFIGLNPSTADEQQDDPTIRRCMGFAKLWGYGTVLVGNIFAIRSTDPSYLKRALQTVVGEENDYYLLKIAKASDMIVIAWGEGGKLSGRGNEVLKLLTNFQLWSLGVNASGHPKHPLYIASATIPMLYGKRDV